MKQLALLESRTARATAGVKALREPVRVVVRRLVGLARSDCVNSVERLIELLGPHPPRHLDPANDLRCACYHLSVIQATPAWADKAGLNAVYRKARAAGPEWHVDHVIPLSHPRVCGLHVPENLRIVPAAHNMTKSNSWSTGQLELNL